MHSEALHSTNHKSGVSRGWKKICLFSFLSSLSFAGECIPQTRMPLQPLCNAHRNNIAIQYVERKRCKNAVSPSHHAVLLSMLPYALVLVLLLIMCTATASTTIAAATTPSSTPSTIVLSSLTPPSLVSPLPSVLLRCAPKPLSGGENLVALCVAIAAFSIMLTSVTQSSSCSSSGAALVLGFTRKASRQYIGAMPVLTFSAGLL